MRIRNVIKEVFQPPMHVFRRVLKFRENGDSYEEIESVSPEAYKESLEIGCTVDSFTDAVNAVPDVSLIDRFSAVDALNAAIAGIAVENSTENEDVKE